MNAFLIAMQFMTRFPVNTAHYRETDVGNSLYWYGSVGFLLGMFFYFISTGLSWIAPSLQSPVIAALVVLAWVISTGALHLDGLADSADAWLGANSAEKAMAIMKDPRCGPAGVVSIVCILLLKFVCLQSVINQNPIYLLLAPTLARAAIPFLFLTTKYVSQGGLGSPFSGQVTVSKAVLQMIPVLFLCFVIAGWSTLMILVLCTLTFAALRHSMRSKVGGMTGDTAGASIEILETVVLMGLLI